MAGSSFGKQFTITTWGESHGKAIGVVIDGVPAGLTLCEADLELYLSRRRPGSNPYGTKRNEADAPEILSGIFEGKTTGTPISVMIRNTSQISKDYSNIASVYRPGHADYTFDQKYGFRDYRGGGRSSGRETIGRVAAGAIALKMLETMGVSVNAYSKAIGGIEVSQIDLSKCSENPFYMPDMVAAEKVAEYAKEKMQQMDSMGGIIECVVKGMPKGAGDPCFEKLDANLAKAIMSIGAVKGFEIGAGFDVAKMTGLTNNDSFCINDGDVVKATNNAGGILGGISDGSDIVLRAAIKPTPSIAAMQNTVNKSGEEIEVSIKGRHDPMIVPRAVVVVEAMTALVLVDALMSNMTAKMDSIIDFYK